MSWKPATLSTVIFIKPVQISARCSCWSLLASVRPTLRVYISEKSKDEWRGSNSSLQVRFRIPGAHTAACLHTDMPAECMSASKGPGMCLRACMCVWDCFSLCVCFQTNMWTWPEHHSEYTQRLIKTYVAMESIILPRKISSVSLVAVSLGEKKKAETLPTSFEQIWWFWNTEESWRCSY